ncbi:unnamed protein product [Mytilus coruscus]|uniref:Ig-like domain-containing protein n=1 Tax=Mytilus coruscus TaxID=42192 RepID=A0A6J8E140_MYTCO|nr:unnamed protein product [Mytilus coruscus]
MDVHFPTQTAKKLVIEFNVSRISLVIQPGILLIHQNINITCTVHGIDIINSNLTRQWSKGPDLICYNGISVDSSKYIEFLTSGNQFKLQIKNVSESDLDSQYQCRYGFETQQKMLLSKNYFEYPPANEVRAIVNTNESDRFFTIKLHFKKIFPLPRCTALVEGTNSSFNLTSSKSFGNYYELDLIHQSADKPNCNVEVIVKCKLIKEYIIPTEDLRKCFSKENPPKELYVILLVIFIPLTLITIIISLVICKIKKTENAKSIIQENASCI